MLNQDTKTKLTTETQHTSERTDRELANEGEGSDMKHIKKIEAQPAKVLAKGEAKRDVRTAPSFSVACIPVGT